MLLHVVPAASFDELEDEQLVLLAQENNEEAFVLLVTRCMPMLQRLSLNYRSAQLESDDLVQEGLLALLSAVRTYRTEQGTSFRTYAYTCVRNRMISALRHGGVDTEPLSDSDEPYDPVESKRQDPAMVVLRHEERQQLRSRLRDLLTPVEYQVLMLYLGGYSYREIARRRSLTTKAVDNALQRLRRKLANAAV